MLAVKKIKELRILDMRGTVKKMGAAIQVSQDVSDESLLALVAPMRTLMDGATRIDVTVAYQDVKVSTDPTDPPIPPMYTDTEFTLSAYNYKYTPTGVTDQDIYGENLDGKNRKVVIIWKDENNQEYQVPLNYFDDTTNVKSPNRSYEYNGETNEIIFGIYIMDDTKYILRRYA